MTTDAEIVGKRIRALRAHKGWTQLQFGQRINSCRAQIVRWEKGYDFPSLEKRLAIAAQLGQAVEVLFHVGSERDDQMEDTALTKMLEISRDREATVSQQLAAAKELRPRRTRNGGTRDNADMAEFRRMMEKADAELTELLREFGIAEHA
ncbi:MAG: helix-turn-helix transcriptional regulator [Rhizomicrobium sp.]|jgi:transcriptional regulator with XRE-family HTH domain